MERPIDPEYEKGYNDGGVFEWRINHDYVTGTRVFPMNPLDVETLKQKMFSEHGNNELYIEGFETGRKDYKELPIVEQIQISSRRPR